MSKVRHSVMLDAENYKKAKAKWGNVSNVLDRALARLLTGDLVFDKQSESITAKDEYLADKVAKLATVQAAHTKALKLQGENIKKLRRLAGLPEVDLI